MISAYKTMQLNTQAFKKKVYLKYALPCVKIWNGVYFFYLDIENNLS